MSELKIVDDEVMVKLARELIGEVFDIHGDTYKDNVDERRIDDLRQFVEDEKINELMNIYNEYKLYEIIPIAYSNIYDVKQQNSIQYIQGLKEKYAQSVRDNFNWDEIQKNTAKLRVSEIKSCIKSVVRTKSPNFKFEKQSDEKIIKYIHAAENFEIVIFVIIDIYDKPQVNIRFAIRDNELKLYLYPISLGTLLDKPKGAWLFDDVQQCEAVMNNILSKYLAILPLLTKIFKNHFK